MLSQVNVVVHCLLFAVKVYIVNNLETIFNRHELWPAVKHIIQKLEDAGFLSYLAGGCIRDALLGYVPKDFDVATSADQMILFAYFQIVMNKEKHLEW